MKMLCSLAIFALLPFMSGAAVYTLCNMAYCQAVPGVLFTTFDDVQNFASNGDIIYVQGSSISYGDAYIYKELTLIGAGHHPNRQNALTSMFNNISVQANNVQLLGLTISYLSGSGYTNGKVRKCRFTGNTGNLPVYMYGAPGWLFEGNIFLSPDTYYGTMNLSGGPTNNLIIQNNIFATPGMKITGIFNNSSERSYILNNVFLGNNSNQTLRDVRYANVENNIFVADYAPDDSYTVLNCVFNNNITFSCNAPNFNTAGMNNLIDVDPQFVNFPVPSGLFDYNFDFSLSPSSPGHNTGTDGTDRGVFGGVGFKFTTAGEPAIAEVTALSITSGTTVAPGGNITISVTSKSVH